MSSHPAHPIATPQQHELELRAVELTGHAQVRAARDRIREALLAEIAPDPQMRACFDWAFEEVMFGAAVWSLNQDPLDPRVVAITRLEHEVDGIRVPGSRWGLDNPDSVYRVIPISGDRRYRLTGRVATRRLTENYFTLWDDRMNTVDVLSGRDLVLDDDGRFEISVDADPANGRANHIRSDATAKEFYIRDVLLDWGLDTCNELHVERLDADGAGGRSRDDQVRLTVEYMERFARQSTGWSRRRTEQPANRVRGGWSRDTGGALRNQVYVPGWFDLADDQCLVIRLETGGAEYFTVPVTNLWGTTMDVVRRTGSMNRAQCVPDPDGSYTVVVSRQDPGAHNWVDTCGLSWGMLTPRLAEFPGGQPTGSVAVTSEVVPLDRLADRLPEGTRWLSPDEREDQRAERARGYLRRLPEVV